MNNSKNSEIYHSIDEIDAIDNPNQAHKVIKKLRESIRFHNYLYYIKNNPAIADPEYDALVQKLESLEEKYPEYASEYSPTQKVGSEPLDEFEKVEHPTPMLSLKAIHKPEKLHEFVDRINRLLQDKKIEYVAEPKYDGVGIEQTIKTGN